MSEPRDDLTPLIQPLPPSPATTQYLVLLRQVDVAITRAVGVPARLWRRRPAPPPGGPADD